VTVGDAFRIEVLAVLAAGSSWNFHEKFPSQPRRVLAFGLVTLNARTAKSAFAMADREEYSLQYPAGF
jgi:hypothetical protein